jgi:hypothetical protein
VPGFTIDRALQQFVADDKVKIVFTLLVLDFILGICAAIAKGEFRLSYIGNFLTKDMLGKVVPWFALYAAGKATTAEIIPVIPNIDFAKLADGAFGVIVAALIASILKSVAELGLTAVKDRTAAVELTTKPPGNPLVRALIAPEEKPREPEEKPRETQVAAV